MHPLQSSPQYARRIAFGLVMESCTLNGRADFLRDLGSTFICKARNPSQTSPRLVNCHTWTVRVWGSPGDLFIEIDHPRCTSDADCDPLALLYRVLLKLSIGAFWVSRCQF